LILSPNGVCLGITLLSPKEKLVWLREWESPITFDQHPLAHGTQLQTT
jgi:hypothetical protein